MKQITFEVTEKKTVFICDGERTDITGTEAEKLLVKLLKELQRHKQVEMVMDAIDIKKWAVQNPIN